MSILSGMEKAGETNDVGRETLYGRCGEEKQEGVWSPYFSSVFPLALFPRRFFQSLHNMALEWFGVLSRADAAIAQATGIVPTRYSHRSGYWGSANVPRPRRNAADCLRPMFPMIRIRSSKLS